MNLQTSKDCHTYGNDLISITASGATAYYHCDGRAATRQITDNTGALTASYIFDGYGNLFDTTGTIDNSYGFTGEQQLNEADSFVFLRARYYDTKTGRFISRDPMLSLDHYAPLGNYLPYALKTFTRLKPSLLNLYVYCFNNPINSLDPNGEKPVKLIGWLWKWIKLIFWSKKTCDIEKNDPKPVCPDKSEYENQADYDTAELEYLLELKKWERRRIEKCKDAAVEAGDIIY
jgi:RHS repeat-associated protein